MDISRLTFTKLNFSSFILNLFPIQLFYLTKCQFQPSSIQDLKLWCHFLFLSNLSLKITSSQLAHTIDSPSKNVYPHSDHSLTTCQFKTSALFPWNILIIWKPVSLLWSLASNQVTTHQQECAQIFYSSQNLLSSGINQSPCSGV